MACAHSGYQPKRYNFIPVNIILSKTEKCSDVVLVLTVLGFVPLSGRIGPKNLLYDIVRSSQDFIHRVHERACRVRCCVDLLWHSDILLLEGLDNC